MDCVLEQNRIILWKHLIRQQVKYISCVPLCGGGYTMPCRTLILINYSIGRTLGSDSRLTFHWLNIHYIGKMQRTEECVSQIPKFQAAFVCDSDGLPNLYPEALIALNILSFVHGNIFTTNQRFNLIATQ